MQKYNNKRTDQEKDYDEIVPEFVKKGGIALQVNATLVKNKGKQPFDFVFCAPNGKSIAFDCKETTKNKFYFSYLKDKEHQIKGLKNALQSKFTKHAGFIIRFTHISDQDYFLDISRYFELKKIVKGVFPNELPKFEIYNFLDWSNN